MALSFAVKSLGVAMLAAGLALSSAFALGGALQRRAALSSKRPATPETWFETSSPGSPKLVTRGRSLFLDSCARCHGADASGDEGPDLHAVQVSDRYIANIIAHGIPHEMPSFAKKHDADDVTALVVYVRSLE